MPSRKFRCSNSACGGPSRRRTGPCQKCSPEKKTGFNLKGKDSDHNSLKRLDHSIGKGSQDTCQYWKVSMSRNLSFILFFPIEGETHFGCVALLELLGGRNTVGRVPVLVVSIRFCFQNNWVPPSSPGSKVPGKPVCGSMRHEFCRRAHLPCQTSLHRSLDDLC